jgi:hypothetical protein
VSATLWVAELRISRATARKLASKHGLEAEEVREAVQCVTGLRFIWDRHPQRGLRAIVETRIRGKTVLVVLYPAEHPLGDAFNLGSAYPLG